MVGSTVAPRSSATGGGHEERTAGPRSRAAINHGDVEQKPGRRFVYFAGGDGGAGCNGRDGRDSGRDRHLWNGCVLGQQAAAGVGNSDRPRRSTSGSVTGRIGTGREIA